MLPLNLDRVELSEDALMPGLQRRYAMNINEGANKCLVKERVWWTALPSQLPCLKVLKEGG